MSSLAINILGGPGVGKSTLASEVFVLLKKRRISCENIPEYAKGKTWEKAMVTLENQIYVFGKQHHSIFRVSGQVDVMIIDSPLLFSILYGKLEGGSSFYNLVLEEFHKYDNLNFFMKRETIYDESGRNQTKEEAIKIDKEIEKILIDNTINFYDYNLNDGAESIVEKIILKLNEESIMG